MSYRSSMLSLTLVCVLASNGAAQQMLDLVPADASAAILLRNPSELKKKGDKFFDDLALNVPIRPSQAFDQLLVFLGIGGGLDDTAPGGVVMLRPQKTGEMGDFLREIENLIYVPLPISDKGRMAGNFGLKEADLQEGKIIALPRDRMIGKSALVRGKHLFLAERETPLQRVLDSKPLSAEFAKAEHATWNGADVLFHFDPRPFGASWLVGLDSALRHFDKGDDPQERKLLDQLRRSLGQVRGTLGAVRLDEGIQLQIAALLEKEAPDARAFLKQVREGARATDLRGLPEGRVVVAQALGGGGDSNGILAKVIFDSALRVFFEPGKFVSAADRPAFAGVFGEIWRQLRGSRLAVYLTRDESKLGLFSAVAILDTEDAQRMLGAVRLLAKIAQGTAEDLAKKQKSETVDIEQLVRDLGDSIYRVRESANVKLRLVGEPALPYLEKVIGKADLETSRRAQRLYGQISEVAAQRRKELLAKDLPKFVRPTFAFIPKAETRADVPVDIIHIRLSERDRIIAKQMEQLLGPEWDRLRVAVHGNQVAVLLGSDVDLLDATLANLRSGKPGLAESPNLGPFAKKSAHHVQLHVSLDALAGLITPRNTPIKPGRLTSFGLSFEEDRVQMNLWAPREELRALLKDQFPN
ncbi:MAG: hypothetical protein L0Y72_13745 [Gemmataceae bacterium]|nr:hypothetical protein [Gemmataceae bacterium]MCI0740104.1 hypothetical protein [Gemmataceae bacterium]